MFLLLIGLAAVIATRQARFYDESIIHEGPRGAKIVLIHLEGVIDDDQAGHVYRQLQTARKDHSVRAIIAAVNSPGGTISGSDRIYQEILRYRQETGQPVVAFMQGMAASGGYYASVACDRIVAEPTTITGSIGVVMSYFVFQEMLENKLGIQPVFLSEGDKKDWPSSFRAPKQEELDYIQERLLTPAYERFVEVVQAGRSSALSSEQVRKLADGGIFVASKALEEKLIDKVGYLDDVVAVALSLAGIQDAQVVEYGASFQDMLSVQSQRPRSTATLHWSSARPSPVHVEPLGSTNNVHPAIQWRYQHGTQMARPLRRRRAWRAGLRLRPSVAGSAPSDRALIGVISDRGFADVKSNCPFVPFGTNYYDPNTGWPPQMWKQFNPEVISSQFELMSELGVNCARVFLTAATFQPDVDAIDEQALKKLDTLVRIAAYRHPIILTGPDHGRSTLLETGPIRRPRSAQGARPFLDRGGTALSRRARHPRVGSPERAADAVAHRLVGAWMERMATVQVHRPGRPEGRVGRGIEGR